MFRRQILAGALGILAAGAALPALAPRALAAQNALSPEDQALVDRAAAYLDSLGEARGRFEQTDARGHVSQGELYLDRPGKARFEYQNPPTLLVVADGYAVMVYDRRLKTFNRYPLGSTPLSLFLQKHVRLDKIDVTGVNRFPGGFSITARGGRGVHGEITLTFSDQPLVLRQWSIVDAQGMRTSVRITDLQPVSGLDPALFQLRNPLRAG